MEARVERSFLHPNLSDVVLFRQVIEQGGLTSNFDVCIYNATSSYKRTFDLETKSGISDLKEYTENLKKMVDLLEEMRLKAEYAKWRVFHGDKLL